MGNAASSSSPAHTLNAYVYHYRNSIEPSLSRS